MDECRIIVLDFDNDLHDQCDCLQFVFELFCICFVIGAIVILALLASWHRI